MKTQRPPEGPLRALFKVLPYSHPELCLDAVVEHECDHEQVDDDVADRNDDVDSECKSASSDSEEGGDEADDEDHEEEDPHDPVEGADVSIGDLLVDPEDDESEDDADDTADEVSADVVEAESAEGGEDSADDGGVSDDVHELGDDVELVGDFSGLNALSECKVHQRTDEGSDSEDDPSDDVVVHLVIYDSADDGKEGRDDHQDSDDPQCRSCSLSVVKE